MRFPTLLLLALFPLTLAAREKPETILEALPEKMADCDRTEVHSYDLPKYGASIAYRKPGFLVTVYVYDLDHPKITEKLDDEVLRGAFDASIAELETATREGYYSDVDERDNGVAKFGPGHDVLRVRYRLTRGKGAAAGERAFSEIHVFGAQDYIVKLRVTGNLEEEAAHSKTLEQMIPMLMDKLRRTPAKQPGKKKTEAASQALPSATISRLAISRSESRQRAA